MKRSANSPEKQTVSLTASPAYDYDTYALATSPEAAENPNSSLMPESPQQHPAEPILNSEQLISPPDEPTLNPEQLMSLPPESTLNSEQLKPLSIEPTSNSQPPISSSQQMYYHYPPACYPSYPPPAWSSCLMPPYCFQPPPFQCPNQFPPGNYCTPYPYPYFGGPCPYAPPVETPSNTPNSSSTFIQQQMPPDTLFYAPPNKTPADIPNNSIKSLNKEKLSLLQPELKFTKRNS
ncbi:uncharacterized protein [Halyomorpha halys]|uniref:uncharacterized protein isoform X2 n=1 Tax=Halyomorpha halys TaxID=286706 RepID=UPI0006D4FC96|nr:leucine-rich repeat extensin-like protein 1 isoform X2 [Halyomorpha halys]